MITDVIYRHAHHLSFKELDRLTGIKKGQPLDPARNEEGRRSIERGYREQGRLFASVTLDEGGNPEDTRVVYNICEGPAVRVRCLHFTGNARFTDQHLRAEVESKRAFLHMPPGGIYVPAIADHDATKIAEYYRNKGYLDVRVGREIAFSDDCSWVDLTYHIYEGQEYRVQDIAVEPAPGRELRYVTRDQIRSFLKLRSGDSYSDTVVDFDVKNIIDYCGYRGIRVLVHKRLSLVDPGLVQVRYEIQEKGPARASSIRIDRGSPMESDEQYKDILVNVTETHTDSLMWGIGVSSDAGAGPK